MALKRILGEWHMVGPLADRPAPRSGGQIPRIFYQTDDGGSGKGDYLDDGVSGTWVQILPQSLHTAATPQFLRAGLGVAAHTGSVLDVASTTQTIGRIRLSGQEFFQASNTSTHGIELRLGVNRSGERQLWIADSALAVNTTNPQFRMRVSSGAGFSALDALSTDGSTALKLAINSIGGNVSVGNIGVTAPLAQLDVRGGGLRVNGALGAAAIAANVMGLDHQGTGQARFISYGNDNSTPGKLIFHQASANNTVFRDAIVVETNGSVILGEQAALATNATGGFAYIPTCAGTPTGTPTSYTGKVPMVYDTTNRILYIYAGGAWRAH